METTVYNPGKGRHETIEVEFMDDNTTRYHPVTRDDAIAMIADYKGDLLIQESGYNYPFRIDDVSRSDIDYDAKKALELKRLYE